MKEGKYADKHVSLATELHIRFTVFDAQTSYKYSHFTAIMFHKRKQRKTEINVINISCVMRQF